MINDQFDLDINSKENNGRKKFNEKLLSKQTKWIIKFDCDAEDEVSVGNWFISGKFMNSSLSKILQWRQVEIHYLGTGRPRDTVISTCVTISFLNVDVLVNCWHTSTF